jgi:hypothetical protein
MCEGRGRGRMRRSEYRAPPPPLLLAASSVLTPLLLSLLLSSLGGGVHAAAPRLTALDIANNVSTSLVPTFAPDVTAYATNVSDAVFDVALGYTTEDGWQANVAVEVTVAERNSTGTSGGIQSTNSTTTNVNNVTLLNVSAMVAIAHGGAGAVQVVNIVLTHSLQAPGFNP